MRTVKFNEEREIREIEIRGVKRGRGIENI